MSPTAKTTSPTPKTTSPTPGDRNPVAHGMFGSSDRLFVGDLDGDLAMLVGGDYEIIKLHPVSIFFMTNLLNAQYTTLKPSRDYCRCFKKLSKTVL